MPERTHWLKGTEWLVWAVPFGLAPLAATVILLAVFQESSRLGAILTSGQLGLYAATTVGTSAYLASIDRQSSSMRWRSGLSLLSYGVLFVAVLIYGAAQAADLIAERLNSDFTPNGRFIAVGTSVSYVAALALAFFATVAHDERQMKSIDAVRKRKEEELRRQFLDLGDDE